MAERQPIETYGRAPHNRLRNAWPILLSVPAPVLIPLLSLVMHIGPSWEPMAIYCLIGHQIWDPLGKEDVCPNIALTVGKCVFSNSGNIRAKANPPKPRSCPKRPFGQ